MQIVSEKAVPVTEVVVDEHLKPFVKENAAEIQEGIKKLADDELLPGAEAVQERLPGLAASFTEDKLKPGAEKLAREIEAQVGLLAAMIGLLGIGPYPGHAL